MDNIYTIERQIFKATEICKMAHDRIQDCERYDYVVRQEAEKVQVGLLTINEAIAAVLRIA